MKRRELLKEDTGNHDTSIVVETILEDIEDEITRMKSFYIDKLISLETNLKKEYGKEAESFFSKLSVDNDETILGQIKEFIENKIIDSEALYQKEFDKFLDENGEEAADEFPEIEDTEYGKAYILLDEIKNIENMFSSSISNIKSNLKYLK